MVSFLEILPEYVLSWMVQHGSERHVCGKEILVSEGTSHASLFKASPFNGACTWVWFEDQGIDLFVECVKE
jgi:hypothetical protein